MGTLTADRAAMAAEAAEFASPEPGGATAARDGTGPRPAPDIVPLLDEAGMLAAEVAFLWPNGAPIHCSGLALSGGGVRAATVALGVLETLAMRGLLRRFDYLSTVSGGGYIGSALSWFWSQHRVEQETQLAAAAPEEIHRFGATPDSFPFQEPMLAPPPLQRAASRNLNFLRQHGSYLTSGDGIGFAGLVVAVLRTVLLSLAIWLPLLIAIFLGLELIDDLLVGSTSPAAASCKGAKGWAALECRPVFKYTLIGAAATGVMFFVGTVLFAFISRSQLSSAVPVRTTRQRTRFVLLILGAGAALCVYAVKAYLERDLQPAIGAQIVLALLTGLGLLLLGVAVYSNPANPGYFLRRGLEKWSGLLIPISVAVVFVGAMPVIVASLRPNPQAGVLTALGPAGSLITLLSGVGTALYGYYLKAKSLLPGVAGQILTTIGSLLFLSGMLLFSFLIAKQLYNPMSVISHIVLITFLSSVILAILMGCIGSINATSLHRFYRDRLMETFMPMTDAIARGNARQSDIADSLSVADVVRTAEERGERPYHLINAHAILVRDEDPKVALRGGDNFVISPAVVGCRSTGWMRTRDYIRRQGTLTLASAMAASGAAANANAGYIGTGFTRDRFVSAVMSLLNIRLGLWVGNPRTLAGPAARRFKRAQVPTYFRPGFSSGIIGLGHHRAARFLELSDGGHFENLGLYELVRRRLDLVMVVDAEQDARISLAALVSSTNRIKEDFGVSIRFFDGKGPEVFLARESNQYPDGVHLAQSPFLVAEIHYPAERGAHDAKVGVLIYLKSTMVKGLEFATLGYRAINPDFPHQSTADQFFDPDQFQAYRNLGRISCAMMADTLALLDNFDDMAALRRCYQAWQPGT